MRDHWVDHSGVIQLNELIFYPPGSYFLDFDGYDPTQQNTTPASTASGSVRAQIRRSTATITGDFVDVTEESSSSSSSSFATSVPRWNLNPADLRLARAYGPGWAGGASHDGAPSGMPRLSGVMPKCKGPQAEEPV